MSDGIPLPRESREDVVNVFAYDEVDRGMLEMLGAERSAVDEWGYTLTPGQHAVFLAWLRSEGHKVLVD